MTSATGTLIPVGAAGAVSDERRLAMLVDRARSEGLQLTGQGGLVQQLTKRVLSLPWKMRSPITSATRSTTWPATAVATPLQRGQVKTVLTDVGPVEVKVPRDISGTWTTGPCHCGHSSPRCTAGIYASYVMPLWAVSGS